MVEAKFEDSETMTHAERLAAEIARANARLVDEGFCVECHRLEDRPAYRLTVFRLSDLGKVRAAQEFPDAAPTLFIDAQHAISACVSALQSEPIPAV
jgi:hypothetical protein